MKGFFKNIISIVISMTLVMSSVPALGLNLVKVKASSYGIANPRVSSGVTTWDCIYFGNYYQSSETDKEPIKWRVLSVDGNNAFLLSDKAIDVVPYNQSQNTNVTWATSTIRSWLNGFDSSNNADGIDYTNNGFINLAFNSSEKSAIKIAEVKNSSFTVIDVGMSLDTSDDSLNTLEYIYLPSVEEVQKPEYGFENNNETTATRHAKPTKYTADGGTANSTYILDVNDNCYWWLRTYSTENELGNSLCYKGYASAVEPEGEINNAYKYYWEPGSHPIRPVLHLDLSKNVWTHAGTVSSDGNVSDEGEIPGYDKNTYKGSSASNNIDFKLGSTSELTIPSDMPIIGGGKLGLDFGNVPVQFNREGNKFQIGIGVKDLVGLYKNGWTTFKKFVDTQKEEYKKGFDNLLDTRAGAASMGWSVKPKISCYGYLEGTIANKGIQSAGGKLAIEMSVKASKEWQTIVVVVPVVIKTSAEVGTKLNVSVGADFSKQSVYFNGDLDLTLPKIKLSGGVGVAYICDVSVYGQASNDVKWSFDGDIEASLSGELGVSAKALCFSYEKALLKGTWTYCGDSKSKAAGNKTSKLSPDKKMSIKVDDTKAEKWNRSSVARALSTENEVILQKDIYDAAKPKILKTDNGKTIITYIEAVKNRSEGNQYAAVYSVYDETTGKWSTPAVVDDDGTADFNLETVADGNNVYFVWSNLKDKISAEELKSLDSESVASKCEIEYAKLDTDTMAVSDNKITSNNNLDTIPGIYADNGKAYVGWVENTNNDVLNLSGTNKIHFGEIDDNSYIESQVKSVSNPVKQVSIGKLGDDIKLAYIEKEDDSNSLNTMDVSGKIDNIKSISGNIENATFSKIDNKNTLLWYSNENNTGTINCLDPEQMNISKLIENNQVSSDYCIVNDGKRDILLSTAVGEDSDSQAIAYVIGQDSGYAELLNSKNKIRNLSTVYREGKYTLLYTDTAADIGENSVDTTTDLKIKTLEADSIVEIESVDYLAEDIMPANKMTVTTQIKNNGLLSETEDIDLVAYYDNEEIGRTSVSDIQSGEEKSVDVNITLPDNITKNSSITIKAIKQDKVQGTYKEKMSSTDLELSVNELVGLADVKVSNIGAFATEATLYVYDKDDKGTVLDTYDCGTLQSGENYDVRVDLSKYSGQNVESLMFEAKSNDDEVFEYNNTYSMYIGDDVLKDIDYIRAGKSKTEYNVGEELDLSDITLEAVYKDGTKEKKEKFETNAKDIDMSTAGTKTLTITYEEVGEKRTVDIPIEVKGEPITSQVTTKETTVKPTTTQVTTKETTVKPTTPRVTTVKPTTAQVTTKKTTVESTTSQETTPKENIKVQRVQKLTGKNVRKKRISLKWQKVSNVRGYEIQYALDRKFKKSQKTRNTSKVSFVIKKLKKKKVYYVRVRAYVVNMDRKIYGSWSKVRKIKVKK